MNITDTHPKSDFLVDNIDLLNITRNKYYSHSYRNGRIKHGFIYVVKGKMHDEFFDEKTENVELRQGELIFIPKGCAYIGNYLEDDTVIRIVQFDILRGELPECISVPVKLDLPDAEKLIGDFFDVPHSSVNSFYYMSRMYELLWRVLGDVAPIPTKYKRLDRAIECLRANYSENLPVSHYAALCDMSEVNFRRLFGEYMEKSPIEYRNDLRLEAARVRILSGEYNVTEAAESVGFENLSFFIKLYKRKFGHTAKRE